MAKNKGGRPPLNLDTEQVEELAKLGCTYDEIAAVLKCSADTLSRRYSDVIENGRQRGNESLRRKQFELAMKGDRVMLIWLGKQRLGQSEKSEQNQQVVFAEASQEVKDQLEKIIMLRAKNDRS